MCPGGYIVDEEKKQGLFSGFCTPGREKRVWASLICVYLSMFYMLYKCCGLCVENISNRTISSSLSHICIYSFIYFLCILPMFHVYYSGVKHLWVLLKTKPTSFVRDLALLWLASARCLVRNQPFQVQSYTAICSFPVEPAQRSPDQSKARATRME